MAPCWAALRKELKVQSQLSPQTRRYIIKVADLRVVTIAATRQFRASGEAVTALTSDVQVNFLLYYLRIYYQLSETDG